MSDKWAKMCRKTMRKDMASVISGKTVKDLRFGEEILLLEAIEEVEHTEEEEEEGLGGSRDSDQSVAGRCSCSPRHSEVVGSGYQCERCGKTFTYSYYRDKHLKYTRCVDRGDRQFPCQLCTR